MNEHTPWWQHWMSLVSVMILLAVSFRYGPVLTAWLLMWWEYR